MDLTELAAAVAAAPTVVGEGARTQWEVGNPVGDAVTVRAPAGVVRYEPADMTITVGAATRFAQLDAILAEHGQECPLDPRDPSATVGGVLACGLSGIRRLRHGPLRDHVLEVRFVTGDGRIVKGGGPTVKNVTGYDVPRLIVGSFGTLGVLGQVTLRCRPRARAASWSRGTASATDVYRPASVLWDGEHLFVRREGTEAELEGAGTVPGFEPCDAPALPDGAHRGRVSVEPGAVCALGRALARGDVRWCAEIGVGTVHVATDTLDALAAVRVVAHAHGGWMLREAGGDGLDGFGCPLPNVPLMRRIKAAFDPDGKLAPGRLPL